MVQENTSAELCPSACWAFWPQPKQALKQSLGGNRYRTGPRTLKQQQLSLLVVNSSYVVEQDENVLCTDCKTATSGSPELYKADNCDIKVILVILQE